MAPAAQIGFLFSYFASRVSATLENEVVMKFQELSHC